MTEILVVAFYLFLKIVFYGIGIIGGLLFLGALINCVLYIIESYVEVKNRDS